MDWRTKIFRAYTGSMLRNFLRDLSIFCEQKFPIFYKKFFTPLKNYAKSKLMKPQLEDCGEGYFVRRCAYEDFIQLKPENDFSIKLPLNFSLQKNFKVAAIVHIFYTELTGELKKFLMNIPTGCDVFISTTSLEKKSIIEKFFSDFNEGRVIIKVFPNRGRDIAPAIVGFRDIYENYDLCVHLHTKKSPHHKTKLSGWRHYLYENILGSPEIVNGILQIFSNDKVGIVFPQYFEGIRDSINWGDDYKLIQNFLCRFGIEVDNRHLIEFPAGSMFWFRPAAIAPLLNCGLTFEDFPEECGQIDGTLAHAIERSFLFIAESTGFIWTKISNVGLQSNSPIELEKNIYRAWHSVMKRY